jgi:hypothetical protein
VLPRGDPCLLRHRRRLQGRHRGVTLSSPTWRLLQGRRRRATVVFSKARLVAAVGGARAPPQRDSCPLRRRAGGCCRGRRHGRRSSFSALFTFITKVDRVSFVVTQGLTCLIVRLV